jgi:hypothetical protein
MTAAISKAQAGTRHQVLNRARHKHLACTGQCRHARADVHGNAADVIADRFALAGMQPGANLNAERPDFVGDGASAAHAACRTVESGQNTVAGPLDFMAAEAGEGAPDRGVMIVKEVAPAMIAERSSFLGRADDVGKKHRGKTTGRRGRTARGDQRPAAFGTPAAAHGGGAGLADRRGLRQAQGPRLSARAVDIASVGSPRTRPRPDGGSACLAELAPSTVHDLLNNQPIKPHKVRYYLDRRDPAFAERKAEVIEVYGAVEMLRSLPEAERSVAIVSYDEKPGIQAIATTAPDLVLCAVGVAGQGLYLRGDNLIECLRRPPVRRLLEGLEGAARFGRLMKPWR